jgi:2,3-dihydroxybiphenyl 1,2-dioxygenase
MSRIKSLGYVGCKVSDLNAWERFLGSAFGLTNLTKDSSGIHRYQIGSHEQWLEFEQSSSDALGYIGWQVHSREDLESLAAKLKERRIRCSWGDEEQRARRGVSELLLLSGPDDVRTELYVGPVKRAASPPPSQLRLAHVVLASEDRRASVEWYGAVFDFKVSDHIFWDGVEASFLRCNPRHHSLALTNRVGDMRGGDLGHFMLEAGSLDEVGRAYDAVKSAGVPLAFTFGRHSNDAAISFYVYTPSGWLVEYGYGGRIVDDPSWQPRLYDAPSIWGHQPQPPPAGDQMKQRY